MDELNRAIKCTERNLENWMVSDIRYDIPKYIKLLIQNQLLIMKNMAGTQGGSNAS